MKKLPRKNRWVRGALILAIALMVQGCEKVTNIPEPSYSHFETLPQQGWIHDEYLDFQPYPSDSLSAAKELYDVVLTVRNRSDYPYKVLWLAVETYDGNKFCEDTISITLAYPSGQWKGRGNHRLFSVDTCLAKGVKIPECYRISISHVMNTDTLYGINNIGVRLIKTK